MVMTTVLYLHDWVMHCLLFVEAGNVPAVFAYVNEDSLMTTVQIVSVMVMLDHLI
jgi:ABC-type molybdate transport system substrate-binding protein